MKNSLRLPGLIDAGLENFVEGWLKKEDVVNDLSLAGS